MNYDDVDKLLQGRCRLVRRTSAGRNTYLLRNDNYLCMVLHKTEIVRWYPDGSIMLYAGAWPSITTKARMNNALGGLARIYQKDWQWYVAEPGHGEPSSDDQEFYNGYTIKAGE